MFVSRKSWTYTKFVGWLLTEDPCPSFRRHNCSRYYYSTSTAAEQIFDQKKLKWTSLPQKKVGNAKQNPLLFGLLCIKKDNSKVARNDIRLIPVCEAFSKDAWNDEKGFLLLLSPVNGALGNFNSGKMHEGRKNNFYLLERNFQINTESAMYLLFFPNKSVNHRQEFHLVLRDKKVWLHSWMETECVWKSWAQQTKEK